MWVRMKTREDLLDDVISVNDLTTSRHQQELLCTVRFCGDGINPKSVQLHLSAMRSYLSGIFCAGKQPCVPLSCWDTIVRSYLPAFSSFSTFISSVIRAVNLWETNTWIRAGEVEIFQLIWWDLRRDQKIHSTHSVVQFTTLVQQFTVYLLVSLFSLHKMKFDFREKDKRLSFSCIFFLKRKNLFTCEVGRL